MTQNSIRRKIWLQVGQNEDGSLPSSWFNSFFAYAIFFSIFIAVIGTETPETSNWKDHLSHTETIIGILFLIEYLIRAWVSTLSKRFGRGLKGTIRFLIQPSALIDLIAITPLFLGGIGSEVYLVRIIRLTRILRLGKLGKFQAAFSRIAYAVSSRLEELKIIGLYTILLILGSSALLYAVEGQIQPEAYGSIPKAMWWSLMTITTVGYGDVYPVTALGKLITALSAIAGICVIAVGAGLIASGFDEASEVRKLEKQKSQKASE